MTPPLPLRSRLLHVGLTKTGTTALQNVASRRRADLLPHGVRYPGQRYNHRRAAFALYHRGGRDAEPRPDAWDALQRELAGDPQRRILISNEFIAGWDDAVAARFLDELGPRTHVVITLRSFGALLPSIWQQYVKSGYTTGFEDFLTVVLGGPAQMTVPPPPNIDRHDQGEVVARWVRAAGAERVTVVVGDKSRPQLISTAFEELLGLPAGMLHDPSQRGSGTNRSLSVDEAGLLLAVNRILAAYRVEDEDLVRIVRRVATTRLLDEGQAPDSRSTLALPPWAADAAAVRGRGFAAAIAAVGVAVIGDLADLGRTPQSRPGRWASPPAVSTDVAAQALVGALSAGLGRGSNFDRTAGTRPFRMSVPARRLLHGVRRIPTRLRSGLRHATDY